MGKITCVEIHALWGYGKFEGMDNFSIGSIHCIEYCFPIHKKRHFWAFIGSKTRFTLWKWFQMWSTRIIINSECPHLYGNFDTKIEVNTMKTRFFSMPWTRSVLQSVDSLISHTLPDTTNPTKTTWKQEKFINRAKSAQTQWTDQIETTLKYYKCRLKFHQQSNSCWWFEYIIVCAF